MKPSRTSRLLTAVVATLVLGSVATTSDAATGSSIKWNEILALLQAGTSDSTALPRQLKNGQAVVNMSNGQVWFQVKGLPYAGPSDVEFGTQDRSAKQVKGTLVCNVLAGSGAILVDTPAVPLSDKGDAKFAGHVSLPSECLTASDNLAFFVRPVDRGPENR